MTTTAHINGQILAAKNEIAVVRALQRFGWLRTRDIAVLVWRLWGKPSSGSQPSLSPPEATGSEIRMAQKTLARLRKKKFILSSIAPNGSNVHALAQRGADVLRVAGIEAGSGKDLIREFQSAFFLHRCIANEIAISAITEGFKAATEREIAQGRWLLGTKGAGTVGKRPDVLIRSKTEAWWVEVERSRKNHTDYKKLLAFLGEIFAVYVPGKRVLLSDGVALAKVIFICTPAFETKLKKDLQNAGWSETVVSRFVVFDSTSYSFKKIQFF